jgi:predicted 2-oxoglutarate/Fe(II)-dependent dioxygenase YbiX
MGRTGGYEDKELTKDEIKNMKRKRNSDLVWLMILGYIKKYTLIFIKLIKMLVGILNGIDQKPCQFTKYKLNQYYDWHCDSWDKPYNKPNTSDHGKIRKLSMTCQLTDGSEYEGGELEFDFRNYDPHMREEL